MSFRGVSWQILDIAGLAISPPPPDFMLDSNNLKPVSLASRLDTGKWLAWLCPTLTKLADQNQSLVSHLFNSIKNQRLKATRCSVMGQTISWLGAVTS